MSSTIINVLIADDEAPARKRLRDLFSNYNNFKIVSEAENVEEVINQINIYKPDVAFLDINMPGASIFKSITQLSKIPLIVFQTAYSEFGVNAYDINAIDYLLKPISRERFKQSLDKITKVMNSSQYLIQKNELVKDVLSVKSGDTIKVIKIDNIYKISIKEGFSFIFTEKSEYFSDKSLNYYENYLNNMGFYRISRNDLINIKYITKLHTSTNGIYTVELFNGEKLNVSRRRIQQLKNYIN